jgi:hypothetical protein
MHPITAPIRIQPCLGLLMAPTPLLPTQENNALKYMGGIQRWNCAAQRSRRGRNSGTLVTDAGEGSCVGYAYTVPYRNARDARSYRPTVEKRTRRSSVSGSRARLREAIHSPRSLNPSAGHISQPLPTQDPSLRRRCGGQSFELIQKGTHRLIDAEPP